MAWLRRARVRDDSGAAALEFALVSFVLFPLVFGMVDYGLFFTDSLGARDGVRIAARQGVVEDFPSSCPDIDGSKSAGNDDLLGNLACAAVDQTGAIGGTTYARVSTARPWERGNDLQVCVAVIGEGVTGLVPMPNDRAVRTKLVMRIEQEDKASLHTGSGSSLVGEANSTNTPNTDPSIWSGWCA